MKKYEFPVEVSKVDSTPTTAVSLTPEKVQVQGLTLVEAHKKFSAFSWATLHKTGDEIVVEKTGISR